MLTRKSKTVEPSQGRLIRPVARMLGRTIDRRTFLKRSGITVGAGAVASQLPFSMLKEAPAADQPASGTTETKRSVCTHCSVGCAIDAVVQNGVWIRQEPVFDSPINMGAHCAKGAAVEITGTANTASDTR